MGTAIPDDPTIFISTLILIYTVFISVYGLLLPTLTRELHSESERSGRKSESSRRPWRWLAQVLIVIAVFVDLWRMENSLNDLYDATIKCLTTGGLADAHVEFIAVWFPANVVVILLTFIVLYARRTSTRDPHDSLSNED